MEGGGGARGLFRRGTYGGSGLEVSLLLKSIRLRVVGSGPQGLRAYCRVSGNVHLADLFKLSPSAMSQRAQ